MNSPTDAEKARQVADQLQAQVQDKGGAFTDWFEELYANANGDAGLVPWGDEKPHPGLVQWMSGRGGGEGKKALDVGCGLGDNAAFLADHGYQVTGIDLSNTAIAWAAKRFAARGIKFLEADLFSLPGNLVGEFDLVHETYTLQALPAKIRTALFATIASLVAPGGRLLVICRSRDEDVVPDGPPWPLAKSELDAFLERGLREVSVSEFLQEKPDGRQIPHYRIEYTRK